MVFWQTPEEQPSYHAIFMPELVEKNAKDLRKRYLSWIFKIGNKHVHGKSLVDHLKIRPGLSYWWMTLFAEKCNWEKSPLIEDAIRLFAFSRWAERRLLHKITVITTKQELAQSLRLWCKRKKIEFRWEKGIKKIPCGIFWGCKLYAGLPRTIQALAWLLRYLIKRFPLQGAGLKEWRESSGSILFISYLFNLLPDKLLRGKYSSHFWGPLPDFLQKRGYRTNWLHHYVPDLLLPNARKTSSYLKKFNQSDEIKQTHVTLDSFLTLQIFFKTLKDWVIVSYSGIKLYKISRQLFGHHSPLFLKDWQESFFGTAAVSNCLFLNLFEKAMRSLPSQKVGLYLQENQPWEMALISAWRRAGHGKLVGVPHSAVRFWDLRYFSDPKNYRTTNPYKMPRPDLVAVNGNAMKKELLLGRYPKRQIVDVEALRYLYLKKQKSFTTASCSQSQEVKLLVLGDYLDKNNRQMLNLLNSAIPLIQKRFKITFKPHPACPLNVKNNSNLDIKTSHDTIARLLIKNNFTYASAFTAASSEAYCFGHPIILALDPQSLNYSSLRETKSVTFVKNYIELKKAIELLIQLAPQKKRSKKLFFLNQDLRCWRKLFSRTHPNQQLSNHHHRFHPTSP